MAKALIGHLHDPRSSAHLASETARLRRRVADLEALVLRITADNDRLAAALRDQADPAGTADADAAALRDLERVSGMQPA